MRKWMLRLHLYLGLLCAPYLIVFGVSSLQFNHHFRFMEPAQRKARWERRLTLPPASANDSEAQAICNALGLGGWTIPWETNRQGNGDLQFGLASPGRHYTIRVFRGQGLVHVDERREGVWPVFNALHGLGPVPGFGITRVWGWYTELCVAAVLFAAVSGVYLFAVRRRDHRAAWAVLGAAGVASLIFMVYLTMWG